MFFNVLFACIDISVFVGVMYSMINLFNFGGICLIDVSLKTVYALFFTIDPSPTKYPPELLTSM